MADFLTRNAPVLLFVGFVMVVGFFFAAEKLGIGKELKRGQSGKRMWIFWFAFGLITYAIVFFLFAAKIIT